MGMKVAETGGNFKQIESGMYIGICYKLIDLGTQHGEYQGTPNTRRQVLISWEFPSELIEEGEYKDQPYSLSKFYTASLNEKANLRKDLESWRGKAFSADELRGFDLDDILGKACMINVITNDKGKQVIASITPLVKGAQAPTGINPQFTFSFADWSDDKFNNLTDGIKKIVMESDEYKNIMQVDSVMSENYAPDDAPPHDDDDAIPF